LKASKFSDAQKAFVLKQGTDGMPVADVCRKAGISQATYFNWKKKYDGLLLTEMRRLKQLEDEDNKLRRVVADLSLDKEMLQDVIRRPRRVCPSSKMPASIPACIPASNFSIEPPIARRILEGLGSSLLTLCLLKSRKHRASVAFLVPCPYRRGHDRTSVRCRFPALVPGAQPRFAGARTRCSATPGGHPASATPWPASALLHRPVALGLALPNLAAGPRRHGAGQTDNRRPVASSRLPPLLAAAVTPPGTDEPRDP
jgi:putative transposase